MTTDRPDDSVSGKPYSPPIWEQGGAMPPPAPPYVGQPYPGGPHEPPKKRSWPARHKILTGVLGLAALFTVGGIAGSFAGGDGGGGKALAPAASPSVTVPAPPPLPPEQEAANSSAASTTKAPPPPPATPALTVAQENAIGAAEDYLSTQGFSKSGLIAQLKFEGYSTADATFAVNHITVNWNEQAVRVAQSYLDMQHFSRSGLISQLKFEGFTTAQARYAADKVGL